MSFSIQIDEKFHLVVVKLWGMLDASGFENYLMALEDMGPFDLPYALLVLLHEDLQIETPTSDVRLAAKRREEFSPDAKRVIVAPGRLAFGLSRLYGAEVTNQAVRFAVFYNIAEAAAALEVNPADIDLAFPC